MHALNQMERKHPRSWDELQSESLFFRRRYSLQTHTNSPVNRPQRRVRSE